MWIGLAALAVLWPARLAGALDGAPLDTRADALLIGIALPALLAINPRLLKLAIVRGLIVALLLWKGALALAVAPDGWCVRFTSPVPLFVDDLRVPHAWDVRADWRTDPPRCSAVMTRPYRSSGEFPTWFYNLPPANWKQPAEESERPPYATVALDVSGFMQASEPGLLRIETGEDVNLSAMVDGAAIQGADLANGVRLPAGFHEIAMTGTLAGERWRLVPTWNDRPVFQSAVATTSRPSEIDAWLRPWANWIGPTLIGALLAVALAQLGRRINHTGAIVATVAFAAASIASEVRQSLMRAVPLLAGATTLMRLPRRLQNTFGAQVLIGIPFLTLIAVRGLDQIGRTTWYTIGDDFWLFQRFAYRIYLQGFWLEGGEQAFWFQPFYRWIAGALHMIFGDSSVGELFWDGACAWIGALFAFHVTRTVAGFKWAVAAATITLAVFTLGPGWYLFGRGLSEITSAGLIYAAALLVLRGRRGAWLPLVLAGVCLAIAFYTRLNNLLFAMAVVGFSLPLRVHAGDWWRARTWWPRASRPAIVAVVASLAAAVVLFSARSYYYTGNLNPLSGTQAGARSVWQTTDEGLTPAENLGGSILMVISMSDPPGWEPRAIPIVAGLAAAILALAGIRRLRELPLNVVLLCLLGVAGAFVARGSAYPGRFSIHLIPVTAALTVSAIALVVQRPRNARSSGA